MKAGYPMRDYEYSFLGYIWNKYLFHGYFNNLPSDTLLKIENIVKL